MSNGNCLQPERALIVANEFSSSARRWRREVDELDIPTVILETHQDPRYTAEAFIRRARHGDVVLGAGGDGTTHTIGNLLLSEEAASNGLDRLPLVPLRGGNANDIATMLNGRKSARQILQEGRCIPLQPLEVSSDEVSNGRHIRYALGYFSVGGSANACVRFEEIKKRSTAMARITGLQMAREVVGAVDELTSAPDFSIQYGHIWQTVTDFAIMRGDIVAKIGRPHANLAEPAFETFLTRSSGVVSVVSDMARMHFGTLHGRTQNALNVRIESQDHQPLTSQFDGEVHNIESGSIIAAKIADKSYLTITTRL